MTLLNTITGDVRLEQPCPRGAALARALGARKVRTHRPFAFVMAAPQAARWATLYAAGFWPCRRAGRTLYRRDPKALGLKDALAIANKVPQSEISSLTANSSAAKTPATD